MTSRVKIPSGMREHMLCQGHPPVSSVADLVRHGETVMKVIKERGEENEGLVKLYESGRAGQQIPQGSIKSFRQYADYMTLSLIPTWPITPVKVSLFLLFRLLMGDITNGTPLRNAYLRSLARSLEHYREETAKFFLSQWPEAGGWIIRDGRGDPESRNDITHDILRICKLAQHRPIETLLDFDAVQKLVTGNNSALTPDAWATRRRLSARWVRDRESANLPERQYAGGKFIGDPPKPPPLSARSTHWNRHLHDLREHTEDLTWISRASNICADDALPCRTPARLLQLDSHEEDFYARGRKRAPARSCEESPNGPIIPHMRSIALNLENLGDLPKLSPDHSPSLQSTRSLITDESSHTPSTCVSAATPFTTELSPSSPQKPELWSCCVLPSLAEAGLHPSFFPLPPSPTDHTQAFQLSLTS